MKKIYLSVLTTILFAISYATVHTVTNAGQTFTPSSISITEGDTVIWSIGGSHNVVEVDMATYNSNGNTPLSGGFSTPFGGDTVIFDNSTIGMHYYVCSPHASNGMKGTVNVAPLPPSTGTLIMTMIADGDCSGGTPKAIELYADGYINFSEFALELQTNSNTTWGSTSNLAALGTATDAYVYVYSDGSNSGAFAMEFPSASQIMTSSVANFNGDDRIRLIDASTMAVLDQFGVDNLDGSGETWEYKDGYAYRNSGTGPDAGFTESNWIIVNGALNTLGLCQGGTDPFESIIGTASYTSIVSPTITVESPTFMMNEADPMTIVTRLIIDPMTSSTNSIEIHLVGGTGSAADLSGVTFPFTVPVSSSDDTLVVPITPNNDAVYEGTETFEFVLRNAMSGLVIGTDSTFVLTMTDDETPPDTTINANPTMISVNEGAGTVDLSFEIGQLSANGTTFTADIELISGDILDVDNYATQSISFAPSGSTTQTVTVNITDDALIEGTETLEFKLTNLSAGLTLGNDSVVSLSISDNDLPTYTIASLTTVDATGTPDSIDVEAQISGVVMGINYADAPDVSFFIHDATGGIGVYNPMGSAGYTVNEGDEVVVQGTVGFFNGLTQLVNIDTIYILGTTSLPAVATVTALDESTEAELIKLSNVTVVNQSDWNTGNGSGFNVDVTDGTNTFSVRIDRSTDLFNLSIPGCVIDVTGIGSQFDNSSPYTSGYQILPRYAADITVIDTCEAVSPSATTIADATAVDAQGDPIMMGSTITLKGIITSPDFRANQGGVEFSFADGTGGIWAYSSDSAQLFVPTVGDSVEVTGNIFAANGVTRIGIDNVSPLGTATPFTPTVVNTALAEDHEAELIMINGLHLTGTWNTSGGSYNVNAEDASGQVYDIRVDADRAELFTINLDNTMTFNLIGIGTQFDPSSPRTEGYQILPRFVSDVQVETGIEEINLSSFKLFPNPANNEVKIELVSNEKQIATVRIIDVLGRIVLSESYTLNFGNNTLTFNVSNITTGSYAIEIKTEKAKHAQKLIIK